MHQKVFLIEVYRKIIGVFDFEVDLEIPEIVSIIFCKGADGVHHQPADRFCGRGGLGGSFRRSAQQAGSGSGQCKGAGPLQESASVESLHKKSSCTQKRFF